MPPVRAFGLATVTIDEIFGELIDVLIVECSVDLRIVGTRRYRQIEGICDEFGFVLARTVFGGRQVIEIARSSNRPVGIEYAELRERLRCEPLDWPRRRLFVFDDWQRF